MTPEQQQVISDALQRAHAHNVSLGEELAREDLLATSERLHRAAKVARDRMQMTLESETAHGLVRAYFGDSRPTTSAEMFRIVVDWLENYRDPEGLIL